MVVLVCKYFVYILIDNMRMSVTDFLIANWFLSIPFLILIFLYVRAFAKRGGQRITVHEATTLINEGAQVIDVRESDEFDVGHITGAKNIPNNDIERRSNEISSDRPIILTCALGQNSPSAGEKLQEQGFKDIYILSGGLTTWAETGLPLVTD